MATGAVVAAGSALALYYVSRRGGVCPDGEPTETHRGVHFAPTSFLDDLYFLAEGLRWVLRPRAARGPPAAPNRMLPMLQGGSRVPRARECQLVGAGSRCALRNQSGALSQSGGLLP